MKKEQFIRLSEIAILFIAFPIIFWLDIIPGYWKFLPLFFLLFYILKILFQNKLFNQNDFSLRNISLRQWLKVIVFSVSIFLILYFNQPKDYFADFENTKVLIAIICYPLFSVLPQEIIYRKFYFSRYKSLFKNEYVLILSNAFFFALAHIYFQNWYVLLITFVGGIIFGFSYLKTKSLLFVSIEHAIYGLIILSSYMNAMFYKAF